MNECTDSAQRLYICSKALFEEVQECHTQFYQLRDNLFVQALQES